MNKSNFIKIGDDDRILIIINNYPIRTQLINIQMWNSRVIFGKINICAFSAVKYNYIFSYIYKYIFLIYINISIYFLISWIEYFDLLCFFKRRHIAL